MNRRSCLPSSPAGSMDNRYWTRRNTCDEDVRAAPHQLVVALTTREAEKSRTIVVPGIVAVELRGNLRDHRGKACSSGAPAAAGRDRATTAAATSAGSACGGTSSTPRRGGQPSLA